jgi:hypothetical protein
MAAYWEDAQYAFLHAQRVLSDRNYAQMVQAQRAAVTGFEQLGQDISPRVLAGAIKDAGGLDCYATIDDYELAIGEFIARRRRHARPRFDVSSLTRCNA